MYKRHLLQIAVSVFTIILMGVSAWAVPGTINYQGKLTDPNGVPFNGNYIMEFYLYNAGSGGSLLWNEQQSVTVTNGVYNVELGTTSAFPLNLFDNNLYLEVRIFDTSTGWQTLSPRQRLTSTPYAMKAAKAADADTLDGQPSAYYAVAAQVQKRVTGTCGPGYSIREIKSDGSVVCETDDVNDAVSNPNGTYNGMSVGYANSAGSASSAGNADLLDGFDSSAFMVAKGCYVSYTNACLSGFTNMGSAGSWGRCYREYYDKLSSFMRPPGGGCPSGWSSESLGSAYVCCQ